jgi:hypothetical protein
LQERYREGGDVASRMPLLSAYFGYAEPANTYWHLVPCQNSRTVSELVFSAILKLLCGTR